jgi:hypothetical protein
MMARKRSLRFWLITAAVVVAALVLLAPGAVAGGAGRLLGEIWVTAMSAVIGLFGALFGR